jgi:sugar phosphate isomerase/epimerase
MKWSLNTYKIGQDWELDFLIEMVKKAGYEGIEYLMDFDQKHGLEWDTPEEKWAEYKEKMAAAGLACASLCSCQNFHAPEKESRDQSVERVKRVIDMADFLECDHIRVLGDRFTDKNRNEVVQNVGECLGLLGAYAQPKDITVSIEMHSSFTVPDASLEAIRIADHPNVGAVFNCVWPPGVTVENVHVFHDEIAGHITMVHTHGAESPETFELYRNLFSKLREIDFQGYVSNECAYTGTDPEKVLALYLGLFRAFAGE